MNVYFMREGLTLGERIALPYPLDGGPKLRWTIALACARETRQLVAQACPPIRGMCRPPCSGSKLMEQHGFPQGEWSFGRGERNA
jgi:hypothetical protein